MGFGVLSRNGAGAAREHPAHLLTLLIGSAALGAGMHGIWIRHDAPGLAVLGIDFLTYIKLLPWQDFANWQRSPWVWSWPLVICSVLTGQLPWAAGWLPGLRLVPIWISRLLLALAAGYAAIQILPLDWAPGNLFQRGNMAQTLCAAFSFGLLILAPLTGPALIRWAKWWLPLAAFGCAPAFLLGLRVYQPYMEQMYLQDLRTGLGLPIAVLGAAVLLGTATFAWGQTGSMGEKR